MRSTTKVFEMINVILFTNSVAVPQYAFVPVD